MLAGALGGVEMAMVDSGIKITPGSGVGAATKYWQETSQILKTRDQF